MRNHHSSRSLRVDFSPSLFGPSPLDDDRDEGAADVGRSQDGLVHRERSRLFTSVDGAVHRYSVVLSPPPPPPPPLRRRLPPPPDTPVPPGPEAPAEGVDDGGGGQHEAADGQRDPVVWQSVTLVHLQSRAKEGP